MNDKKLQIIGCAAGLGGRTPGTAGGPECIANSRFFNAIKDSADWRLTVEPEVDVSGRLAPRIAKMSQALSSAVSEALSARSKIAVIGGDHTCAIGTWNGAAQVLGKAHDLGLIWVDAHMDSHTPETSETGNIHGMPLAALLGYGYPELAHLLAYEPVLKPQNVCLVGVRSFESGERQLLERLNVRIYYMDEVRQRGLQVVLDEAVMHVTAHTQAFGVSVDLDAFDPEDAPGVDVPEEQGIRGQEFLELWPGIVKHPQYLMSEIVELNPSKDQKSKTEKLTVAMLESML